MNMAKHPFDLVDVLRDRLRDLVLERTRLRSDLGFREAFEGLVRSADFLPRILFEVRPPFLRLKQAAFDREGAQMHVDIAAVIARESKKPDSWQLFRRPYKHQVDAFRASAGRGKSVVLATGTASGKTESMALPILDGILKDRERGATGGTKALFVFPLNALATDQRERLDRLASRIGVTVGTMNGLTPSTEKKRLRRDPPDVLITNFTMLEYMLLRPADRGFLGSSLRYLALDEAHVYRGALGRDMGLLLHRLRLHLSQADADANQLRAFLASATLGGSDDEVTRFASELTGIQPSEFEVIWPTLDLQQVEELPQTVRCLVAPLVRDLPRVPGQPMCTNQAPPVQEVAQGPRAGGGLPADTVRAAIQRWMDAGPDESTLREWQLKVHSLAHGLGGVLLDLPTDQGIAFGKLYQEEHLEDPQEPSDRQLEPVNKHGRPLFRLVACDRCGMPFLFGYVHGGDDGGERLCAEPPPIGEDGHVRRLFLAWPGFEGSLADAGLDAFHVDGGTRRLLKPAVARGARRFLVVDDDPKTSPWEASQLKECPACGARNPRGSVTTDFVTDTEEATGVLAKDLLDAQFESDEGQPDRPRLESLFQRPHDDDLALPKLLSFSDTRRDAARFAPILTSFQFRAWVLRRMQAALEARREQARRDDVRPGMVLEKAVDAICRDVQPLLKAFLEAVRLGDDEPKPEFEVEFELLRLFGKRVRRSERGENLCLATLYPAPEVIDRWTGTSGLPPDVARTLFLRLLDEVRYEMFWLKGVHVEGDHEFPIGQNQKRSFLGLEGEGDGEASIGWIQWIRGKEKEQQETNLARTVRLALGPTMGKTEWDTALSKLWQCLCDSGLLVRRATEGRGEGYVLDWERLRFDRPRSFVRCPACGNVTADDRWLGDQCLTCGKQVQKELGKPYRAAPHDGNLFAAVEHTAQWGNKASKLVMQAFKSWENGGSDVRGPVHLLSCSTTYEVGVDLGDLSHVLLRNLPASSASFVQRIGRAGRRAGQAALSVTYLRPFATDRVILLDPARWLRVRPPTVKRDVPVMVRRHVRAALLSWAIRQCPELGGFGEDEDAESIRVANGGSAPANLTLAHFYIDATHVSRCAPLSSQPKVEDWLTSYDQRLPRDGYTAVCERLANVPSGLHEAILEHVAGDLPEEQRSLEDMVDDLGKRLAEHRDAFEKQCGFHYALVAEVQESLSGNAREQALEMLRRQIAEPYRPPRSQGLWQQMVIPEWAKAGITPGYAFPIDPVRLDVGSGRGRMLELERDATLGLAEYVPGAHVTAGARVFQSQGIQLTSPPKPESLHLEANWQIALGVQWCVYCSLCGHLKILSRREDLASDPAYRGGHCPGCGSHLALPPSYSSPAPRKGGKGRGFEARVLGSDQHLFPVVQPRGFVTRDHGGRVFSRQATIPAQPPRWLPQATDNYELRELSSWRLRYRRLERERIAVLNLGRYGQCGFRLCPNTGFDLDLRHGKDSMRKADVHWLGKFKVPLVPLADRVGLFTQFPTDVLVIEPASEHAGVWGEIVAKGLMTALLVVAPDVLQAERREVGGLLYPRQPPGGKRHLQVVLYDNVHGGAGLMRELASLLDGEKGLFSRALELLESCKCRLSCPNCLKLSWNQRDHGSLDRFRSRDWLRAARKVQL